jgi:choline dehydrogenase-like flavoprotein
MAFLTPRERRALAAICDTLVPALPLASDALGCYAPTHTHQLVSRLEEAYEQVVDEESRRELKLLLNGFENRVFNGVVNGTWAAFSQLEQAEREAVLRRWALSPFFAQRKAFQAFKRLTLFLAYANPAEGPHPVWPLLNYPGASAPDASAQRDVTPTPITHDTTLTTDVLVIGSGAGGGVVAGELSAAGYEVIVVEKGQYYADHEMRGDEYQSTQEMYEKHGALTTRDTALMVLAGSTLGGGTTINWAGSLRPPRYVLEEWARDYGFSEALSDEMQESIQAVSQRLNVNTDECALNGNNAVFERGCEALGYPVEIIPRNVKGCEDCGYCSYGCAFGAKQTTVKTYLRDAHHRGAKIITGAAVEHITRAGGRAAGAVVRVKQPDGSACTLTIRARVVVVSAGAIHTPALLRRSGLSNRHIGANLHLHPTTVIFSLFDTPIRTWQGAPMTRVTKKFSNLDGQGYGYVLEVAPAHPGLTAATLPWTGGQPHKGLVAQIEHMANVICIVRDRHGGRVLTDKRGQPVLDYRLHPDDRRHLQQGVLEALKVHQAAGAREIFSPHNARLGYVNDGSASFEAFLATVEQHGLKPNDFPLFSAHQMSSCRLAGSAALGAVKPSGETYEVRDLFVVDGSVLPTATGVNPMLTIMSVAHFLAQRVKGALAGR